MRRREVLLLSAWGMWFVSASASACASTPREPSLNVIQREDLDRSRELEPREFQVGDRVRVTLASRIAPAPLIGVVVEASHDTLVVEREEGGLRRLSRRQVDMIEVSVRREFETGEAAGYGVLAAAPLLVLLAIALPIIAAEGGGATAWSILGAAVGGGLLVGALIGGTTPQDTWVDGRWPDFQAPLVPADSLVKDRSSIDGADR